MMKLNYWSCTIFFLFFEMMHLCGQIKISGKVTSSNGKALRAVSVSILNSYDGAVTDSLGKFSFNTTETGSQTVEIKMTGYGTQTEKLVLDKQEVVLKIVLKEKINELDAVTVSAGSFEAGDKKRAATVLSSLDIVTTAGSNGDLTSALKTLPGAQQVGDQEGLFVRGGAGYETKQFIDGAFVSSPFFTSIPGIAQRGRFSPFLFKGTVFTTGGYSALYGQALSSALILETIDMPQRSEVSASISPIFVGTGMQHLAKNKKFSYGFTYSFTHLWAYFSIVKQTPDYFNIPKVHNADYNFRVKTNTGGMIKFYALFSRNDLGLRRPNIDSPQLLNAFGLGSSYFFSSLSWRENLGRGWKMQALAGFSAIADDIDGNLQNTRHDVVKTGLNYIDTNVFSIHARQPFVQSKWVFEKKIIGLTTIRFGGEQWFTKIKNDINDKKYSIDNHVSSFFSEGDIQFSNYFALKAGIRSEYAAAFSKWNIAPRISTAYKTGINSQIGGAYGIFYQNPENNQLYYNNIGFTKASHYILSYQYSPAGRTLRIESYYKMYDKLVSTANIPDNSGDGYAQGFEVFWRDKKTIKDFDYWISYSYLDTKRKYLNYPERLMPNYAANHTVNLICKKFFTKIRTGFNATYSFASPRPFYDIAYDAVKSSYYVGSSGNTIPYSTAGCSINYLPNLGKPKKKTFIVIVASISNIFNRTQVFGYNFSYNGQKSTPVTLPANQSFFIGCFLNWGVDRSDDIINNNL